ncbi:MAG: tRNA dihydrouridine synthase DusB [Bacteroidetes bacterium]|nr:tRNA dihydrouridine synthase DusB [Bacteroidota bacterium]MBU1117116.1 tRNA dihydrouridine synthase DusB [Bacteroidota bacterium]MBU1798647.1 tRNA dihydrouridine synthase DusB [Bacteroidota bacterium]
MKLKNFDLGNKLIVAPMADVSDAPFRKISKEYGAGLTFTPMVSAKGIVENEFHALRIFSFGRDEKPIGVQLLGNSPDYLAGAVQELKNYKPDVIDINCGCPVDKVTKHNLGAQLLDDPIYMGKLIESMVKVAGDVAISVKLRLGTSDGKINILETSKIAQESGASFIIVHTRTKTKKYKEDPDWEWLRKVKETVNIPVVGNGSLFSPQDIKRMILETGIDSAMIARGALGNPFIFNRYNKLVETGVDSGEPGIDEIAEAAIKHSNLLAREYSETIATIKARKNIVWYFKNLDGVMEFASKIMRAKNIEEEIKVIHEHAENLKQKFYPKDDRELIDQKFKERVLFWLDE